MLMAGFYGNSSYWQLLPREKCILNTIPRLYKRHGDESSFIIPFYSATLNMNVENQEQTSCIQSGIIVLFKSNLHVG